MQSAAGLTDDFSRIGWRAIADADGACTEELGADAWRYGAENSSPPRRRGNDARSRIAVASFLCEDDCGCGRRGFHQQASVAPYLPKQLCQFGIPSSGILRDTACHGDQEIKLHFVLEECDWAIHDLSMKSAGGAKIRKRAAPAAPGRLPLRPGHRVESVRDAPGCESFPRRSCRRPRSLRGAPRTSRCGPQP